MENLWNTRFSQKDYAYGTWPNVFFKEIDYSNYVKISSKISGDLEFAIYEKV